jgi:hypothetical protein
MEKIRVIIDRDDDDDHIVFNTINIRKARLVWLHNEIMLRCWDRMGKYPSIESLLIFLTYLRNADPYEDIAQRL